MKNSTILCKVFCFSCSSLTHPSLRSLKHFPFQKFLYISVYFCLCTLKEKKKKQRRWERSEEKNKKKVFFPFHSTLCTKCTYIYVEFYIATGNGELCENTKSIDCTFIVLFHESKWIERIYHVTLESIWILDVHSISNKIHFCIGRWNFLHIPVESYSQVSNLYELWVKWKFFQFFLLRTLHHAIQHQRCIRDDIKFKKFLVRRVRRRRRCRHRIESIFIPIWNVIRIFIISWAFFVPSYREFLVPPDIIYSILILHGTWNELKLPKFDLSVFLLYVECIGIFGTEQVCWYKNLYHPRY